MTPTSDGERGPVETKPFAILRRPWCWLHGHDWLAVRGFDGHAKRVEPKWLCQRCGKSQWRPSGESTSHHHRRSP